jgi:hypothetical protein
MNQVISSVISELCEDIPPYPAPDGFIWKKEPDNFRDGIVWEGNWVLSNQIIKIECLQKTKQETKKSYPSCKWKCPNQHMENHFCYEKKGGYDKWTNTCQDILIKKQREQISKTFNPDYHVCQHKTHSVCSNSLCCDIFWHEGECHFISNDGECGYAVRFGDQI